MSEMYTDKINNMIKLIEKFNDSYPSSDEALKDISTLTVINENILDEEITKNPARFAWISSLAAVAKERELRAENEYKKTERLLILHYTSGTMPMPNGAKVTIPNVEAAAKTHPDREAAYAIYVKAKKESDMLYAIVKALDKKGELIRTYSSNLRGEQDASFSVKSNQALKDYKDKYGTQQGGATK